MMMTFFVRVIWDKAITHIVESPSTLNAKHNQQISVRKDNKWGMSPTLFFYVIIASMRKDIHTKKRQKIALYSE